MGIRSSLRPGLTGEAMTDSERIAELEQAMHAMTGHYWRFQGRLAALELITTLGTLNFAKTQPDPFGFIQSYVGSMTETKKKLSPEMYDQAMAPRLVAETVHAIDDLLADLLQHAGQFKRGTG